MSAVPATKIRHPEELTVPSKKKIEQVLPHLTSEGRRDLLRDIFNALVDAKESGDLGHVNHVVDAWYRTLLFKIQPDHEERWEKARVVIAAHPEGTEQDRLQEQLDEVAEAED